MKQKHTDANRLVDLGTRMDELVRELVKIHLMLNPAAAAAEPAGQAGPQGEPASGANARTADSATEGVVSGSQLSSELAVGRLVPHWSPQEDMQDVLLTIKPQDVKVGLGWVCWHAFDSSWWPAWYDQRLIKADFEVWALHPARWPACDS